MTKRLLDSTKWLWCLLVLNGVWTPVESVSVKNPPKNPTTVEAQAKFFQDFFSVQLSPYKIEFGHVCEDPNTWEQRYESNDLKSHRHMGKVRWGDKKGGYGEHYWDLNHAGHADEHPDTSYDGDDGSYDPSKDNSDNDSYDEPSDVAPKYQSDDSAPYDAEKASYSPYDESGRAKRHHRVKGHKRHYKEDDDDADTEPEAKPRKTKEPKQSHKEHLQAELTHSEEVTDDDDEVKEVEERKPVRKLKKPKKQETVKEFQDYTQPEARQLSDEPSPVQPHLYFPPRQPQPQLQQQTQFVPYEQGAGVRHYQAAVTGPRLFLEPSTGHVVDRTTGQAYVLQPVAAGTNYN